MRDIGAVWLGDRRCRFCVWAPNSDHVQLHILKPVDRILRMDSRDRGYHQTIVDDIEPGAEYRYRLRENLELPDPASSFQPHGVHGPSCVITENFPWTDSAWRGIPIDSYIAYELHIGTFTPEGTFDAIIPRLADFVSLGITALEFMPVAQYPGRRNWGYDGAYPFAVQNSYGGPFGLKKLVNACHERGLAVILDVVYNHLGPEGNYLPQFGPYFTDRYKTPWGSAVNFDNAWSDEVRHYFLQNALYWVTEFHVDTLRLDAVHAILDHSAEPFLEELASAVHTRGIDLNRRIYAIAESALNDTRVIRQPELGGYGLDAQWNDDFHHALHTLLTGECEGYYLDFGGFQHMARAFSEGFVYSGKYSVARQRRHGNSSRNIAPVKFVVYAQNHDQIGNRMMGERLNQLVSFEHQKLAAGAVLLSPFLPLLFMGDEYGETAPFQYFVDHSDPDLVEAVRRGRREEFSSFKWAAEPPDPQAESTFQRSKLHHELKGEGRHHVLLEFHRELIRLRKSVPALRRLTKSHMDVLSLEETQTLIVRRWESGNEAVNILNFKNTPVSLTERIPGGRWRRCLDSSDSRWMGPGSRIPEQFATESMRTIELNPASVVLLERFRED